MAPEFGFRARGQSATSNNMSATDPFNVALNVGYGILECRASSAVNAAGLSESLGFLHEAQPGATPVVYDLMEPYWWLVDYTLLRTLEHRTLLMADFVVTNDYRRRTRGEAVSAVARELGSVLGEMTGHRGMGKRWETVLGDNPKRLVKFVSGAAPDVVFGSPMNLVDPYVYGDLRERLLGLSVGEARTLGIRKTTLWYAQRNLRLGSPTIIYGPTRRRMTAGAEAPAA